MPPVVHRGLFLLPAFSERNQNYENAQITDPGADPNQVDQGKALNVELDVIGGAPRQVQIQVLCQAAENADIGIGSFLWISKGFL